MKKKIYFFYTKLFVKKLLYYHKQDSSTFVKSKMFWKKNLTLKILTAMNSNKKLIKFNFDFKP